MERHEARMLAEITECFSVQALLAVALVALLLFP